MNPRLKGLQDQLQVQINRANELGAKSELTTDEREEAKALPDQIKATQADIESAKALDAASKNADGYLNTPVTQSITALVAPNDLSAIRTQPKAEAPLPAAIHRGRARNFTGKTQEEANLKAYRFGMWMAAMSGNTNARQFCQAQGIPFERDYSAAGGVTNVNEDGGFLVPTEFDNDIIDLRELYGVFRGFSRVVPMGADTRNIPRRSSGLTAYFKGEAEAATASKKGWSNVELVAKKLMVLAYWSNELNEDSIIGVGDDLAGEIAYAFAQKEDDCGFNGDGTSTYGGIVGVRQKLKDVDGTIGNIKGLQVASGNAYSEIVLTDFSGVKGRLPQYAVEGAAWYCHKLFYETVMEKLMLAAGGVTAAEIAAGRKELTFMGYPVRISQVMPSAEANSQVVCLFGNLAKATTFGDRRMTTLKLSEHDAFTTDELAIRGTERFDINAHDVGSTVVAGPIVGLITAAS